MSGFKLFIPYKPRLMVCRKLARTIVAIIMRYGKRVVCCFNIFTPIKYHVYKQCTCNSAEGHNGP